MPFGDMTSWGDSSSSTSKGCHNSASCSNPSSSGTQKGRGLATILHGGLCCLCCLLLLGWCWPLCCSVAL